MSIGMFQINDGQSLTFTNGRLTPSWGSPLRRPHRLSSATLLKMTAPYSAPPWSRCSATKRLTTSSSASKSPRRKPRPRTGLRREHAPPDRPSRTGHRRRRLRDRQHRAGPAATPAPVAGQHRRAHISFSIGPPSSSCCSHRLWSARRVATESLWCSSIYVGSRPSRHVRSCGRRPGARAGSQPTEGSRSETSSAVSAETSFW